MLALREKLLRQTIARNTAWPRGIWGDNLWTLAALRLNEKTDEAKARMLKAAEEYIAGHRVGDDPALPTPESPAGAPWQAAETMPAYWSLAAITPGWALEWLVGKHLPALVGRLIRRCRIVGVMDIIESLEREPAAAGLTADDLDELRRADLVATGTIDGGSLYLVGEVSFTADNDDILRAARQAAASRHRPVAPHAGDQSLVNLANQAFRDRQAAL